MKIKKIKEAEEGETWKEIILYLIKSVPKIFIIETLVLNILLHVSFFITKQFAKTSYKTDNFNFYYIGDMNNEEYLAFTNICDQINEESKHNPFYKDKKIDLIFHSNAVSYNFSAAFTKSSAFTCSFGKKSYIQFCESDFLNNKLKSTYYKDKHQHVLTEVAKHEVTHAYLSYGEGFIDFIKIRKWRNEGLAEQFNKCNCYNNELYIKTLLDGKKIRNDKGGFEYFCYKLAVQYLHNVRNMDYYEIYKAKGLNYKRIISELKKYSKEEILSWY